MISYNRALEITRCESIETTLRTRRRLWAGGAERTGWEGDRESTDCLQSDIRAFRIAGGWKMTVLEAEVWVEIVTEGGRG